MGREGMEEAGEMVGQEETFSGLIVPLQVTEEVFKEEEEETLLVVTEEVLEALIEMGIINPKAAGLGALMIMAPKVVGAMVLVASSSIITQAVARVVDMETVGHHMETVGHHQIPCRVHQITTAKGRTMGRVDTTREVAVAMVQITTTRAIIKGTTNHHLIKALLLPSCPTARATTASSINSSSMEDSSGASIRARHLLRILVLIKVHPMVKGNGATVLPKVKASGASGITAVVGTILLGGMDHKEEATENGV